MSSYKILQLSVVVFVPLTTTLPQFFSLNVGFGSSDAQSQITHLESQSQPTFQSNSPSQSQFFQPETKFQSNPSQSFQPETLIPSNPSPPALQPPVLSRNRPAPIKNGPSFSSAPQQETSFNPRKGPSFSSSQEDSRVFSEPNERGVKSHQDALKENALHRQQLAEVIAKHNQKIENQIKQVPILRDQEDDSKNEALKPSGFLKTQQQILRQSPDPHNIIQTSAPQSTTDLNTIEDKLDILKFVANQSKNKPVLFENNSKSSKMELLEDKSKSSKPKPFQSKSKSFTKSTEATPNNFDHLPKEITEHLKEIFNLNNQIDQLVERADTIVMKRMMLQKKKKELLEISRRKEKKQFEEINTDEYIEYDNLEVEEKEEKNTRRGLIPLDIRVPNRSR